MKAVGETGLRATSRVDLGRKEDTKYKGLSTVNVGIIKGRRTKGPESRLTVEDLQGVGKASGASPGNNTVYTSFHRCSSVVLGGTRFLTLRASS